jgi:hypothetical protein
LYDAWSILVKRKSNYEAMNNGSEVSNLPRILSDASSYSTMHYWNQK